MALTKSEMEAKLAALEDRISILFAVTENMEGRFEQGMEMCEGWAVELQVALAAAEKQIGSFRQGKPPGRQE